MKKIILTPERLERLLSTVEPYVEVGNPTAIVQKALDMEGDPPVAKVSSSAETIEGAIKEYEEADQFSDEEEAAAFQAVALATTEEEMRTVFSSVLYFLEDQGSPSFLMGVRKMAELQNPELIAETLEVAEAERTDTVTNTGKPEGWDEGGGC